MDRTLSEIPALCEKAGIECYVGAWLGGYKIENEKEIKNLILYLHMNYFLF